MVKAVRGAIKISENTKLAIFDASIRLISTLCKHNTITKTDIISIVFSVTKDLFKANPASGLRIHGFSETPLFCVQEAEIENSCSGVLRVLLTYNTEEETDPKPVYLDGAEVLRPDLFPDSL